MKIFALLILAIVVVAAQDASEDVNGERIALPCCTKSQTTTALHNLYTWIFSNYNCDPLFQCIFKCLGIAIAPTGCPPNSAFHVSFNLWLLNNYKCIPNQLLQCLKGCIRYNSFPPCPVIGFPTEFANPAFSLPQA